MQQGFGSASPPASGKKLPKLRSLEPFKVGGAEKNSPPQLHPRTWGHLTLLPTEQHGEAGEERGGSTMERGGVGRDSAEEPESGAARAHQPSQLTVQDSHAERPSESKLFSQSPIAQPQRRHHGVRQRRWGSWVSETHASILCGLHSPAAMHLIAFLNQSIHDV